MPTEASSETAPEELAGGAAEENSRPPSPGQMLSAARVQQNLSQREVAETLHITMHYVNAIEHDEHDKLPGAVFAKGYIKRYAEIMALDETAVMAAYEGPVMPVRQRLREAAEIQENHYALANRCRR